MKVRFLNLSVSDPAERLAFHTALDNILDHGQLVIGPEVAAFEQEVCHYTKSQFAIGVNSGSDALFLALKALGIGQGDEVITSCMSFVATANAISLTGAIPVFADINDDFNIDSASIEQLITPNTKAIIPVHYGGLMANMPAIMAIANRHNLKVIEDASQAFGATYDQKLAGTFGDLGAISLNPMKLLAAFGEAGVVITNNRTYRDTLEALRYNGLVDRQSCHWVSTNGRLDTLQAAFLQYRLQNIAKLHQRRRQIATHYQARFGHLVQCPSDDQHRQHAYYTFSILTQQRDALQAFLLANDIEVKVYHPVVTSEPVYAQARAVTVHATHYFAQKLALPCNEKMTDREMEYVANKVVEFFS